MQISPIRPFVPILALAASILGLAPPLAAGTTSTAVVVVESGEPAPKNSGVLSDLSDPIIEGEGEIVFRGNIRDNGFLVGSGVFRAGPTPGTTEQVVLEGQPSPDGNGNFGSFAGDRRYVNANGEVGFDHVLENTLGGFSDAWTVFAGRGGDTPLRIVARANQVIPNTGGDRFGFTMILFGFNDGGEAAFANLTAVGELFGIWRGDGTPGSLTRIVLEGDPTPAGDGILGGGAPLSLMSVLNDAGQVAFHDVALLDDDVVSGIFRGSGPGTLVRIARQDDPVPSGDGVYGFFLGIGITSVLSINDAGDVAFAAQLLGTDGGVTDDQGLFVGDGVRTLELVRKGNPAPDGNGLYLDLLSTAQYILNNRGQVLFQALMSGAAGGADTGIFLASAAGVEQVARLAQAAPGGGVFASFSTVMALNNIGQVLFRAQVDGGGTGTETGLFLWERGALRAVVREGDTLAGYGTILSVAGQTGFGGEPRPEASPLNDLGEVTYDFFATGGGGLVIDSAGPVFADGFESGDFSAWTATVP